MKGILKGFNERFQNFLKGFKKMLKGCKEIERLNERLNVFSTFHCKILRKWKDVLCYPRPSPETPVLFMGVYFPRLNIPPPPIFGQILEIPKLVDYSPQNFGGSGINKPTFSGRRSNFFWKFPFLQWKKCHFSTNKSKFCHYAEKKFGH